MAGYAGRTLKASGLLALLLVLILAVAGLLVLEFDYISPGYQSFILGWFGIALSVVAATLYAFLRRPRTGDYGLMDRVLHRLALQVTPLAELSFDLDQKFGVENAPEVQNGRHIFVSGLARAGTTVLMRRIYEAGTHCSLTYRNMPFVLAPNLWPRLSSAGKTAEAPKERAHSDRILVNVDSPESLDEVFWRIFDGDSYISDTHLSPHTPDSENCEMFADYVSAILAADPKGRTRYLSKNNNNILRLTAIRRTFPEAVILIPFRDPLSHAASLLRQHRNFVERQKEDPFILSYMTWLGHFEFGQGHRPFQVGGELPKRSPSELSYWVEMWCHIYGWLEDSAPEDAVFVSYEDLCCNPETWNRIADLCGLEDAAEGPEFVIAPSNRDESLPDELVEEARAIYDRLTQRARAALGVAA